MTEYQKEIIKAKKIFNIKSNCYVLEHRIGRVIDDALRRNNKLNTETIHAICYDLFYMLDELKKNNEIHAFRLYKIFKLCLNGLDDKLFFDDTVTNPKEFTYKKYRELIEKAKPFIVNYEEVKIRIPRDPNDEYNEIYFALLNNYSLRKNEVTNLLSNVYGKNKKAKVPKRTINELKYVKSIFHRIITKGGKEKGLSEKEIKDKINETNQNFKDYL